MSKQVTVRGEPRCGPVVTRAVAGARRNAIVGLIAETLGETKNVDSAARSWGAARRAGQQRRRKKEATTHEVIREFPDTMPIGASELAALEAHLGAEIDAILRLSN